MFELIRSLSTDIFPLTYQTHQFSRSVNVEIMHAAVLAVIGFTEKSLPDGQPLQDANCERVNDGFH